MTREEIYLEARKWTGVRFLHQGRSRMGIDCVGMCQKVGDAFGIEYDDLQGYARCPTDLRFLRHLRKYLPSYPINGNRVGCVGVFRQSVYPCHIGIFGQDDKGHLTLINARADRGKVVEEVWMEGVFHLVELRQFPGMED